jgi:AhpD family alkylhydroperoxidase
MSARERIVRRDVVGDAKWRAAHHTEEPMEARMKNPATTLPGAMEALLALGKAVGAGGVSRTTLELCNLRASQINGCAVCIDMHSRALKKLGERDEKLFAVAAWREAPYFSDAERAALALTEAETRLADRGDAVADSVWQEAARHFEEKALAALVLSIGAINLWNRLNATTRQPSGEWTSRYV